MKHTRQQEIKQLFFERGKLTVKELCDRFDASIETIRRDLAQLEAESIIHRVYGGAALADGTEHPNRISPWQLRSYNHKAEKQLVARETVQHIPDNVSLALDAGTTSLEVAKCLSMRKNLKVITNDLRIAQTVCENTDHEVCLIGGILKKNDFITCGFFSNEFLNCIFSVDIAVLVPDGFSDSIGVAEHNYNMCQMKKAYVKRAEKVILVTDSSKFAIKAPYKVCEMKEVDMLITDDGIPKESRERLCAKGLNCIVVKTEESK